MHVNLLMFGARRSLDLFVRGIFLGCFVFLLTMVQSGYAQDYSALKTKYVKMKDKIETAQTAYETACKIDTDRNLTSDFLTRLYQLREVDNLNQKTTSVVEKLRHYRVIFVTGIIFNVVDWNFWDSYYQEIFEWGEANNLNFEKAPLDYDGKLPSENGADQNEYVEPNASPAFNENAIKKLIEDDDASNLPVIFVSHSKGSNDVAYFLMKNPKYWNRQNARVKGWLSLNPAFWGSTLSEDTVRNPLASMAAYFFAQKERDRVQSAGEFQKMLSITGALEKYYPDNTVNPELLDVLKSPFLKILNFKSFVSGDHAAKSPAMVVRENLPLGYHEEAPTDGFVWYPSMEIPCVRFIGVEGYDHWDLIKPSNRIDECGDPISVIPEWITLFENFFEIS
ncbi:MAG: hypothetical protein KDD48_05875 [Bdellovibrionales bacterium]|nr:hypothetical protein [Bdellovibrionales bacterium]